MNLLFLDESSHPFRISDSHLVTIQLERMKEKTIIWQRQETPSTVTKYTQKFHSIPVTSRKLILNKTFLKLLFSLLEKYVAILVEKRSLNSNL